MADIDKLLKFSNFIDDVGDVLEILLKDDKVSAKDLLNKDLYPELIDLVKWKAFFTTHKTELKEELKDLSPDEILLLCMTLLDAVKAVHEKLAD